jgi:hypothetical protein
MSGAKMRDLSQDLERLFQEGSVAGASDAVLLERYVADGDTPALEALIARHQAMLLHTCHDVLGNAADAEEAFQATVVILLRRDGTVRDRRVAAPRGVPGRPSGPRRHRATAGEREARRRHGVAHVCSSARSRSARARRAATGSS